MSNPKEKKIHLGIHKIRVLKSSFGDLGGATKDDIQLSFNFNLAFDIEHDLVIVTVNVVYWNDNPVNEVASFKIANEFIVINLDQFSLSPDQLKLPNQITGTLVSIAISQSRALVSDNLTGTELDGIYLPLISMDNIIASLEKITLKPEL